ncbi:MAG: CoA transferase [Myxococcota bacterium]
MNAPLTNIRVLDLTWNLPGPYATDQLAQLGADVIKIEPPKGDPARGMPPLFEALNHRKQCQTLDLQQPEDQARLLELVETVDVLVEGFRPGVMDRLGCGPKVARVRNPRLIYCSISAFGQTSPQREQPAHDLNIQALTGVCHLNRDARDHPDGLALPVADFAAASRAVAFICAALYARERNDGQGTTLDIAMTEEVGAWSHVWSLVDLVGASGDRIPSWAKPLAQPTLRRIARIGLHALPHYGVYRCRDGRHIALGIVTEGHFWRGLCEALDLPRFADWSLPARALGSPILKTVLARTFRKHTQAEWVARLAHLPVTAVRTPAEFFSENTAARISDEYSTK